MFDDFIRTYKVFKERGVPDPLLETLRLFDLLSGGAIRKTGLTQPCGHEIDMYRVAEKRKEGVPLAYIIGKTVFMGVQLRVSPDTLIPRAETELLVKTALEFIEAKKTHGCDLNVIELGTGSGNIAILLAMHSDGVKIMASDISAGAIEIARRNVDRYDLQDRISLFCGDLFDPFDNPEYNGKIDMIVSNPPYIPTNSIKNLDPEIVNHEPKVALDAGAYGIDFLRRIIAGGVAILSPCGILILEIGAGQEKLVSRLLTNNGNYEGIEYFDDGTAVRVISAARKQEVKPAG